MCELYLVWLLMSVVCVRADGELYLVWLLTSVLCVTADGEVCVS